MSTIQTTMRKLNQVHEHANPEWQRKGRLLNIVVFGIIVICILLLLVTLGFTLTGTVPSSDSLFLIASLVITIVVLGGIYLLNRTRSTVAAGIIFVLYLLLNFFFANTPSEMIEGPFAFIFVIPILLAAFIIHSTAAFAIAGVTSVAFFIVAATAGLEAPIVVVAGFLTFALVAWLSGRSVERALQNLRQTNKELDLINQELDKRVIERTEALNNALDQVIQESNRIEAVLKSIADGVVVLNPEGEIFITNPALKGLIGQEPNAITGKALSEVMKDSVPEEHQKELLDKMSESDVSVENVKINWGPKTLSTTFATVQDGSGTDSGKVVVFRDYTAEAELDAMKSAFVSMASHELRTPLNAILGYSDMMKEGVLGKINEEQVQTTERVIANVRRMLTLVNNLLDSASIEAGGLQPNLSEFNIQNMLDHVDNIIRVLAEKKGLELNVELDEQLPDTIKSDQGRLEQVLVNLTGNAVKFTKEGSITVKVFKVDDKRWGIDVRDTGVGIPEDAQAYIFDSFRQVDDPYTREVGGSGLGLSITKQLVEMLGGTITVDSAVGRGTTFAIRLPFEIKEVAKA